MGYESKIYFVRKSRPFREEEKRYAQVLCMINLSKIGGCPKCFGKETDCYFYGPYGGNQEVLKDRYDDPIKESSLTDLAAWCDEFTKQRGEEFMLIKLLKTVAMALDRDAQPYEDIVALHFGY